MCRWHTPCSPTARTKTECCKADKMDFSVSLVIGLKAETPTSRSEQVRAGAWIRFSDTRYVLGLSRWEMHSVPDTGVGSQLIVSKEGSLTKPVLRVTFPKHLPTWLPLLRIAHLSSYHGRLRTSFPGTNCPEGKVSAGDSGLL